MNKPSFWKRLSSYFVSYVEAQRPALVGPPLEVVYCSGKYQLHAGRANYSFGELHTAFADAFQELDVYARNPQRVLVLGLGAGSIPHLLQAAGLSPHITGVEIDAGVIELGKAYFGLGDYPSLEIIVADAVAFLAENTLQWDLVCVDVFVEDEVPAQLDTPHMLQALMRAMAPGGMLIWNRLVLNEAQRQRTEQFWQLAALTLPNVRLHRVLSNHMVVATRSD